MRADVLTQLAAAAGVDMSTAGAAFERAREVALKRNGGRDDTRTFLLTVEGFRAKHSFDLGSIDVCKKEAGHAGEARPSAVP